MTSYGLERRLDEGLDLRPSGGLQEKAVVPVLLLDEHNGPTDLFLNRSNTNHGLRL